MHLSKFVRIYSRGATVNALWIKLLPSNETLVGIDHFCTKNLGYDRLATRPEMESVEGEMGNHWKKDA
jgi:hypothetical protein